MKKLGVSAAILLIAVMGISRSRWSKTSKDSNNQSSASQAASLAKPASPLTGATSQPALAQLREKLSEDRSESSAEQSSFQNRLEDLIAEMPKLSNQAKPQTDADGDIHGELPEEMIEARVLGQLRKATYENPQHATRSQVVYAGCAERTDFSNAVRAVCFMRALELSIKVKNPQTIAGLEVPSQIRNLAQKLINKGQL